MSQSTGLQVRVAVQPEPKGMGDALLRAEPLLAGDGPIFIIQVHDVVDETLHRDLLAAFAADPTASYLAGVEMQQYFPGGYLIVEGDGRITGMVEKPGAGNQPSNLVNIVAHIHSQAGVLFEAIRAEYARDLSSDDHYERAMDALMKRQVYRVVPYSGAWKALKFPWQVLDVMEYFLGQIKGQHIDPTAYIHPNAVINGDVIIGPGAKVGRGRRSSPGRRLPGQPISGRRPSSATMRWCGIRWCWIERTWALRPRWHGATWRMTARCMPAGFWTRFLRRTSIFRRGVQRPTCESTGGMCRSM